MRAESVLMLDLHGKSIYQARVALEAALRRRGGAYRLRVIHGYINGMRLKDMLFDEYAAHPAVLRLERGPNLGQTDLVLREL